MICTRCGATFDAKSVFCPECGADLAPNVGFCHKCGLFRKNNLST